VFWREKKECCGISISECSNPQVVYCLPLHVVLVVVESKFEMVVGKSVSE
jgi:hypothetical protein